MRSVPKCREVSTPMKIKKKYGWIKISTMFYLVHAVLKLRSRLVQHPLEDFVSWRATHGVLKEGHNVRVHLAHNEVVHVEEF